VQTAARPSGQTVARGRRCGRLRRARESPLATPHRCLSAEAAGGPPCSCSPRPNRPCARRPPPPLQPPPCRGAAAEETNAAFQERGSGRYGERGGRVDGRRLSALCSPVVGTIRWRESSRPYTLSEAGQRWTAFSTSLPFDRHRPPAPRDVSEWRLLHRVAARVTAAAAASVAPHPRPRRQSARTRYP